MATRKVTYYEMVTTTRCVTVEVDNIEDDIEVRHKGQEIAKQKGWDDTVERVQRWHVEHVSEKEDVPKFGNPLVFEDIDFI